MSIVDNLFSNPLVKNAAFSSLRKVMKENNLKGIFVTKDEQDNFDFKFVNEEQVLVPKSDFDEMKRIYLEHLNK